MITIIIELKKKKKKDNGINYKLYIYIFLVIYMKKKYLNQIIINAVYLIIILMKILLDTG